MHLMANSGTKHLKRTLAAIRRVVRSRSLWRPGDRLLMACSGGVDSVAATGLLALLMPSLGHELCVAHIDHGLRPDGEADRGLVATLAAQLELPFVCATLHLEKGPNLQARARAGRYEALRGLADKERCPRIVTAHHADDQAETLLMRMARGCGQEAIAGIRSHRDDHVIRPLLGLSRRDLMTCAEQLGISWREDPSNKDPVYTRNRLRRDVMPALISALPDAARGMARTAENISRWRQASSWWVDRALGAHMVMGHGADGGRWLSVPDELVPREFGPLNLLLGRVGDHLRLDHPGLRATEQLATILRAPHTAETTCQLRGMTVVWRGERVRFEARFIAHPRGADYPEDDGASAGDISTAGGDDEPDLGSLN